MKLPHENFLRMPLPKANQLKNFQHKEVATEMKAFLKKIMRAQKLAYMTSRRNKYDIEFLQFISSGGILPFAFFPCLDQIRQEGPCAQG